MAVVDQCKISFFSIPQGRCHDTDNQYLLVLSTELIFLTPMASGAAGRAKFGLYSAYSSLLYWAIVNVVWISREAIRFSDIADIQTGGSSLYSPLGITIIINGRCSGDDD